MKITKNGMTKIIDQDLWPYYENKCWKPVENEVKATLKAPKKNTVVTPAVGSEVLSEEVVNDELKGD